MVIARGTSIAAAWTAALEECDALGGDVFSLVVSVESPAEPTGRDRQVRDLVDRTLAAAGRYDTQTVANTIFPVSLSSGGASRLYKIYNQNTWPVLRRARDNSKGTYFLRMIESRGALGEGGQLSALISKMSAELNRGTQVLRAAYEVAIYDPTRDVGSRMGFPCLSHVSLKYDPKDRVVHLSATYRNQHLFTRGFGNYLGLARLQAFVARETGLGVGRLVCHATHAQVDLGKRRRATLIAESRRILDGTGGR